MHGAETRAAREYRAERFVELKSFWGMLIINETGNGDVIMFGMFGSAKVKAYCLGDTLNPMKKYALVDLNSLPRLENVELQDEAYNLLTLTVGTQKRYHSFEMVCATWLALIDISSKNVQHSCAGQKNTLESGFRSYLFDTMDETKRNGVPRGLFSHIEKYL